MLSRVADSLYWTSRYLERAEHTARLIDVNLSQMLDQKREASAHRWELTLASLKAGSVPEDMDAYGLTGLMTFDQTNSASILSSLASARENARQVREQISSEMWEQLNAFYLQVRDRNMEEMWQGEPHEFFRSVKEGAHLFQGITDATLTHGEGWHFLQLGRYMERANATAVLIQVHADTILTQYEAEQRGSIASVNYLEMVGLLKSCTAFEAYCQVYKASLQPEHILEFLLLNAEFPRSVRFAVEVVQSTLKAISSATETGRAGRAERVAGRLRAALAYAQVDEIVADNLRTFLEDIQKKCGQIHAAIHHTYVDYPIEMEI